MRALFLVALLLAAPAAAELAALRPLAVVDDATLRLGDLFDGAGDKASRAIGPSPGPGKRLVLETPQLAAIARAHGLVWRPLGAEERIVVERPGRPLARDDIVAALIAELEPLGLDPDSELDLGSFAPPMVPPAVAVTIGVEAPSYDAASRRFAATLIVLAEGMPTLRQRIAGRGLPTVPVVLATRRLGIGEVVRASDLRPGRVRVERARAGAAQLPEQVVGQQLKRPLAAGMPFVMGDLGAPVMVAKNTLVTLLLEAPGIALSAQGRALDDAARGGVVPVMNLASRQVVEGVVVAPGQVRIALADGGRR